MTIRRSIQTKNKLAATAVETVVAVEIVDVKYSKALGSVSDIFYLSHQ